MALAPAIADPDVAVAKVVDRPVGAVPAALRRAARQAVLDIDELARPPSILDPDITALQQLGRRARFRFRGRGE